LIRFGGEKGISMGLDVCLYYIFNTHFAWAQQTLGKGKNNLGAVPIATSLGMFVTRLFIC